MMRGKKKTLCRFLSLFLCVLMLSFHFPLLAIAQDQRSQTVTGSVNGTNVRVRTSPGTASNANLLQYNGNTVRLDIPHSLVILQSNIPDENGGSIPWHQVSFQYQGTALSGYIRSDLVTVNQVNNTPTTDQTFEEQLAAFPESYRGMLRAIHDAHPNWYFEAFDTQLDWTAVQNKENELGRSFTNSTVLSHYSTIPGSYDWYTDTFFPLEAGVWYQAAPGLVAYYMDPRNFLNEQDLFQFESLAFNEATQTEANIEAMLKGSFMEGQKTTAPDGSPISYAMAFLLAARENGVSAFHLVARCIQEVGWNGKNYCKGEYPGYEGYYNFFNIGAYNGAQDGMVYAKDHGWTSPYLAITAGGAFIAGSYIARGQNTPYFQKFDVADTVDFGSHQYMTNVAAPRSEGRIQFGKYQEMGFLESSFTFRIPIYRNMPESACPVPTPAGSPNNLLRDLSIEGYSLTPTFDLYGSTSQFTLIINGDVSSLNVSAVAVSSSATLMGNLGTVPIWTGENILTVTCTSASGSAKHYTIRVLLNGVGSDGEKPDPGTSEQPIPSGWNPPQTIRGVLITGIAPGTDVSAFLSSLGVFGKAYAVLTDENGTAVSGGPMRTGLLLNYFDGTNTTQFRIVIYGDANKDSAIDAIDLLMVRRNLLGITALDASATESADVNHDGTVDAIDLLLLRRTLLGLSTITQ